MKKVDIKQIVLDVLTMYEDPDVGGITEPDFEAFADAVERRVSKNECLYHVSQRSKNTENEQCTMPRFDIERNDLYEYDKPKERTKKRLTEIANCGMEEVGIAQFGYKGVMSGLYIEKVWGYSDSNFKGYMDWAKGLIAKSLNVA